MLILMNQKLIKKSKDSDKKETNDENQDKEIKQGQQELEITTEEQIITLYNYSEYKSSKSSKIKQKSTNNNKTLDKSFKIMFNKNLTKFIQDPYNMLIYN